MARSTVLPQLSKTVMWRLPSSHVDRATDWLVTLMEPGKHYKHGELVTMLTDMKFETSNAKYAITSATTQGRIIKHKEGYIVKTMENEQG